MAGPARLRNIQKFPNATGTVPIPRAVSRTETDARAKSQRNAFTRAVFEFHQKYGRDPQYEILFFRGCHTSFETVLEIWEEK